jgi:hypothetical protein
MNYCRLVLGEVGFCVVLRSEKWWLAVGLDELEVSTSSREASSRFRSFADIHQQLILHLFQQQFPIFVENKF